MEPKKDDAPTGTAPGSDARVNDNASLPVLEPNLLGSTYQATVDAFTVPPSLSARLSARIRNYANKQWSYFVRELGESQDAMRLVRLAISGERRLTPEERSLVQEKLSDLVRIFPAGLIAAASVASPIPGVAMLTPWLLARLGLMPSNWREAHMVEKLEREMQEALALEDHDRVREHQLQIDTLKKYSLAHDAVAREAAVLTFWDANHNGRWDVEELEAYRHAADELALRATKYMHRKDWYLLHDGHVFGAVRLSEVPGFQEVSKNRQADCPTIEALLICHHGNSGWIRAVDLLDRLHNDVEPHR